MGRAQRQPPQEIEPFERLGEIIGFPPDSLPLLQTALTHTSYANEERIESNERLEFLGDAVLGLVVGEYLFRNYAEADEGELAKIRAQVVKASALAACGKKIDLGRYLRLGRGEAFTGGRARESILADAFEAIVGAVFIASGFDAARALVLKYLEEEIRAAARGQRFFDFKTRLQEELQSRGDKPIYEVTRECGPDHGKEFTVAVHAGGRRLGLGHGRSKKEAEQQAARQALEQLAIRENGR